MLKKKIQDYLTSVDSTLREALETIDRGSYGIMLTVDHEGVVQGILTDGNVRRALLRGASLDDLVSKYMNTDFIYGRSTNSHKENVNLLNDKIRHLPILDEAGRPVDLISWAEMWRLPVTEPYLGGNELKYVSDCITSNWISSQGHYITRFEDSLSKYLSVEHSVATSSGTTALHLALVSLGIGTGDEVIVPTLTFAACANVILQCGATPVFADISKDSWTIDPVLIEGLITEQTKAIMPVHLYGHPSDMDPILDIARKNDLYVIEDCAESLGATYKDRLTGTFGHVACFSFFANKVITTGEGGMLVTDDKAIMERARILRDHGMSKTKRYWNEFAGFNYRMTNMQAAIGVAQMEKIDNFLARRRDITDRYNANLSGINGLTLPPEKEWAKNIFWLYTILLDANELGISIEDLTERLKQKGIETRPVFHPLHLQPPYPKGDGLLKVSEDVSKRGMSLPTGNDITIEDIDKVTVAIRSIIEKK